jgi:predicted nucleic acid-binding protein
MSSYIVVDASLMVARLVPQDKSHQPSHTWMQAQLEQEVTLLSPALLLAEVAGAISRRTGVPPLAQRTIAVLQDLPGLRLVEMDHELARASAELAARLGLRGADAFYVALAARLDLPLATLDRD